MLAAENVVGLICWTTSTNTTIPYNAKTGNKILDKFIKY
jgi:hypothetical protein